MSILPLLLLLVITKSRAQDSTILDSFRDLFDIPLERDAPMRTTPKKINNNCVCGQVNTVSRESDEKVINGVEVNPRYKYPWMVALIIKGKFRCGGSLINDKFILTAGHCILDKDPKTYAAVLGVHNISRININPTDLTGEPYGQVVKISLIKRHKKYTSFPTLRYDLALLKLQSTVKFTQQVSPVCLPAYQEVYSQPSIDSVIMGWGNTETGAPSDVLKETVVKVFRSADCIKQSQYPPGKIGNDVICASAPGKDTCQGDSGGPLVEKGNPSYTQLGIVSWGTGCAKDGYPGVYTSVSTFVNHIYSLTRGGTYCRNPNLGQ